MFLFLVTLPLEGTMGEPYCCCSFEIFGVVAVISCMHREGLSSGTVGSSSSNSSSSSSSRIISHNGNPLLKAGCLTGRRSLDARDFLAPLGHRILPGKFLNRKLSTFRAFFNRWPRRDFSTGRVRRKLDFVEGNFGGPWSPSKASSSSSQKVDVVHKGGSGQRFAAKVLHYC